MGRRGDQGLSLPLSSSNRLLFGAHVEDERGQGPDSQDDEDQVLQRGEDAPSRATSVQRWKGYKYIACNIEAMNT